MGTKRITCKFCGEYMKSYDLYVSHIESSHSESIPQDMTAWRFVYYLKTGKTHGSCIICKNDTEWNEKTHKYHRFCNNPKCKEKYVETFQNRMIGKYGKVNLLNDPEQQKKMLANRKISGVYVWRDHVHETPYTGTYELSFLMFLDEIMEFDPDDVIGPSPHTYYYIYEGKKHFYIPDFFIPSLNLEIEIKEGTNNHPKIQAVDKVKERLKDEVMKSNSNSFNYIKIIEKNNFRFIEFLDEAKKRFLNGDKRPIVMCESVEDNLFDELITEYGIFHDTPLEKPIEKITERYSMSKGTNKNKNNMPNRYMTKKSAVFCTIMYGLKTISSTPGNGYLQGYENKYKIIITKASKHEFENTVYTLYKLDNKNGNAIESMTLKEFADKYKVKYEINNEKSLDVTKIKKEIRRAQSILREEVNNSSILTNKDFYLKSFTDSFFIEDIEKLANHECKSLSIAVHDYDMIPMSEEAKRVDNELKMVVKNTNNKLKPNSEIELESDRSQTLFYFYILNNITESSDIITESIGDKYIRITYNGNGIYQEFKENVSFNVWKEFKNSNATKWLPIPPAYEGNYKSYFTIKGYKMFMKETYPFIIKYLDKNKIKVEEIHFNDSPNVVYKDEFQIVVDGNSDIITENKIINDKDIYYNKDKFDSGEINLCFITGHSGSGKSSMGRDMESNRIEHYDLDDVISNWNFSDSNLKEYGDLIYSFFKGSGKKYRYTSRKDWDNDSIWDNKDEYKDAYEISIIKDFIKYTKSYANSHKNIKFVIEGVWIFHFIDPKEIDKYAVYIKGTSQAISSIRAAKRDSDGNNKFKKSIDFTKQIVSPLRTKNYIRDEQKVVKFRNYFKDKIKKQEVVTESCKDVDTARKFLQDVDKIAKKYDANFFIVTDGASITRNGRGESNPAVRNAREKQIEWERKNGFDPDEDWS